MLDFCRNLIYKAKMINITSLVVFKMVLVDYLYCYIVKTLQ